MKEPIKVVVFSTHPTQYHAQLWREISQNKDFQVRVLYATDMSVRGYKDLEFNCELSWDQPLTHGVDVKILTLAKKVTTYSPRVSQCLLDEALKGFKPDVAIMTAYSKLFWWDAYRWICRNNTKLVLRTEASDVAGQRGWFKSLIRDLLLRKFYKRVDAFCVIGNEADRHFSRLGVPERKRFRSPYCVDTDMFEKQYRELSPIRDKLRKKLGVGQGDRVLIFSGKLIQRKDPMLLLHSIKALPTKLQDKTHLIVVGDGALRNDFCAFAQSFLGSRFHYQGFVNQGKLGEAYIVADILILPSAKGFHETWGLVVNEAMLFGCMAIVSDAVGCHTDIIDKKVGRVFAAGNAFQLKQMLSEVLNLSDEELENCADYAREKISGFSSKEALNGICEALHSAVCR